MRLWIARLATFIAFVVIIAAIVLYRDANTPLRYEPNIGMEDYSQPFPFFGIMLTMHDWFFKSIPNVVVPPPFRILERVTAFGEARAIQVAARLNIADILYEYKAPMPLEELAKAIGANEDKTWRFMSFLMSMGLFTETLPNSKLYLNNKLSAALIASHPNGIKYMVLHMGLDMWRAWGELEYSLQTPDDGQPAAYLPTVFNSSYWEFLDATPESKSIFNRAMRSADGVNSKALAQDYTWSSYKRIVDIGGCLGSFLHNLLQSYPQLKGVLFDLPKVIADAATVWQSSEYDSIRNHIEMVTGDFFNVETIPTFEDGDVIIMRMILHDWMDEDCKKILQNLRTKAANANVRLALVEAVIGTPEHWSIRGFMDMHMMINFNARERTAQQWKQLLQDSGWEMTKIIPTRTVYSVIEATPTTTS